MRKKSSDKWSIKSLTKKDFSWKLFSSSLFLKEWQGDRSIRFKE